MCHHPRSFIHPTGRRFVYYCEICDRTYTARELGLNPRALGTNPRAKRARFRRKSSHKT